MDLEIENKTKNVKFFSNKTISLTTFLTGPLAAGYLIRENFISLNKRDLGNKAFLISIVFTVVLFSGIFMIPEKIIDKFPSQILPILYSAVVYFLVDKYQGEILKTHEKLENSFYSGWKALGIGMISLLTIIILILGFVYLSPNGENLDRYDEKMEVFYQNESESIKFYNHLETETDYSLLKELEEIVIPKWEQNIQIIHSVSKIEDLPGEIVVRNKGLLKYSELRLKAFQLFKKVIEEDSNAYSAALDEVNNEIAEQLKLLEN